MTHPAEAAWQTGGEYSDAVPEPEPDEPTSTTGRSPAPGANPMVDHPTHYNLHPAGIECIDVIEEMTLNVGTAIKHLWRQGLKPDNHAIQDIEKAITYLGFEIERLKRKDKRENPLLTIDGSV